MGTIEHIEKRGETRGIQLGKKRGEELKEIKVVLSGYEKGYDIPTISDVTGINLAKVKVILKKNGKI